MQRVLGVWMVAALAVCGATWAADDDGIMGAWEGSITGESGTVSARLIGEGRGNFRGDIQIGDKRIPVTGKAQGAYAAFVGSLDYRGKPETVTAYVAEPGKINGQFTAADGKTQNFSISRVTKKSPTEGASPPAGAVVLLGSDGKQDSWIRTPEKWWQLLDGSMGVASGGSLRTAQEFGSCQLHVEFRTPYMPTEEVGGQGRGNSGVYVAGLYEVQVLDSFGDEPAWNLCGGIYKIATPIAAPSFPPLTWQTYDIDFTAAKFDGSGKKTANARITVRHNGVVIHDNIELPNPTAGGVADNDLPKGPLMLQDHGDQVTYRNIWLVEK